jgi:low affinity Fe/Cu permease
MSETFRHFSEVIAKAVGTSWAFLLAVAIVLVWAATGPMFGYSDTWQLLINTGTTVVTFLMVFIIQNSQNRDSKVIGIKLDELLRAVEGARTELVGLDHMSEEELEEVHSQFTKLAGKVGSLLTDDLRFIDRELESRRGRQPAPTTS